MRRFRATVLEAVTDHLSTRNVQRGGPYRHSHEVDAMIARARDSVAAFVNARTADEIAFGLNATSFIRSISLAIGQTLGSRPEIVVSELDHEANVATWLALERAGARIVWWQAGRRRAALDPADLAIAADRAHAARRVHRGLERDRQPSSTSPDVARRAHAVGAEVFLDAVHYAPHGSIDVQALRLRLPGVLGIQDIRAAHGVRVVPARGDQSPADVS